MSVVAAQSAGSPPIPQAPGAMPLLGHALALYRDPFAFLLSLRDHADDRGLVRIRLGWMPVYVVTTHERLHEVLVREGRKFEKGRFFQRLKGLAGEGLSTADGELHRRNRRLIQPMFSKERIAGYSEIMSRNARALSDSWQPGQQVDIYEAAASYAIDSIAMSLFGSEIGRPAVETIRTELPVLLDMLLKRAASPKMLDRLPVRYNRIFDRASQHLSGVIDEVITTARATGHMDDHDDLLAQLLREEDLDDVQVRDEVATLLFAGAETTASTLAWAWHYLAQHPVFGEQVVAQVREVVGDDRPVTIADVPRLTVLRRVLDEVIRLHGVTLLMRRNTDPVALGDTTLPPGTEVAFSLYAIHRDPSLFGPDAHRFNPDRWLDPEVDARKFTPFGGGNRKCIGDQFALAEATIAAAEILRVWQLTPAEGHTPQQVISAVARPDRIPMTVHRR
ncbi:cytochrome P450 [Streptomyces sp. NPDC050161]|uniref:cytochrome P450 n=1 Tax=Streptomyces sp. NPDC050161 TaxID=3365604 RepID=UPI0037982210